MIQESDKIYSQSPDEKLKADSTDPTAGYLSDKIDTATLNVNTSTHKLEIKDVFVRISGDEMTGELKISGSTKADGYLYAGTDDPTNTTRLNYDGYFYATRVYNAVYNDIADFIVIPNDVEIEYGKVYKRNKDFTISTTNWYLDDFIGIASDTYGYGLGNSAGKRIPIAIAGFVLAYVDQQYPPGSPLVAGPNGKLTLLKEEDLIANQYKIVAFYDRPERNSIWNGIIVDGRHWVKVR